jgi:hypothetical protein
MRRDSGTIANVLLLQARQRPVVIRGARAVGHPSLAEGHLRRRLFGQMLRRAWVLPVPAGY